MFYENICSRCNEEAGSSKELERVKEGSIYVRESSRTIYERSKEHWSDWRSKDDRSHILRHQVECHEGDKDPQFIMRTVRFFKTNLSRQSSRKTGVRMKRCLGAHPPS